MHANAQICTPTPSSTPVCVAQITVDGDTSTNDCVIGLASGAAGNAPLADPASADAQLLESAVTALMQVRWGSGGRRGERRRSHSCRSTGCAGMDLVWTSWSARWFAPGSPHKVNLNAARVPQSTFINFLALCVDTWMTAFAPLPPGPPPGRCSCGTCQGLAKSIAWDGEGATCLLEIEVTGAASDADARVIARSVAGSSLAKSAFFGHDPNWGRIAAAAGYSGACGVGRHTRAWVTLNLHTLPHVCPWAVLHTLQLPSLSGCCLHLVATPRSPAPGAAPHGQLRGHHTVGALVTTVKLLARRRPQVNFSSTLPYSFPCLKPGSIRSNDAFLFHPAPMLPRTQASSSTRPTWACGWAPCS